MNPIHNCVIDEPGNYDVKSIFADWEEEHGCLERAEFIRLQLVNSGDWLRQQVLLNKHAFEWSGIVGRHCATEEILRNTDVTDDKPVVEWYCGFPSYVKTRIGMWVANAKKYPLLPLHHVECVDKVPFLCERGAMWYKEFDFWTPEQVPAHSILPAVIFRMMTKEDVGSIVASDSHTLTQLLSKTLMEYYRDRTTLAHVPSAH